MKAVAYMVGFGLLLVACGSCMGGAPAQDGVAVAAHAAAPSEALASAVTGIPTSDNGLPGWSAVSEDTLDDQRGGFDMGNGLIASFGIDRATYVNGNLVTSTSFNIPDIGHMTTTQAQAMQTALNTVQVTQIGPNNTFDPSALASKMGGTVIQNTLNNQNIQNITTINASTNSLNAFREGSLQEALQQAQLQSLGH